MRNWLRRIVPYGLIVLYAYLMYQMGILPIVEQMLDMYIGYMGLFADYLSFGLKLPCKLITYLYLFISLGKNGAGVNLLFYLSPSIVFWMGGVLRSRYFTMYSYVLRRRSFEKRRRWTGHS